jgi:DUF4097 and DUF4098 domain-containing protein YvlB
MGGSIRLNSAAGVVVANSGGGDIELRGLTEGAQVRTASGDIVAEFAGGQNFTGATLESGSGDVTIYLAPNVHATVQAEVVGGPGHRIRSDFSEIVVNNSGSYGARVQTAKGNLNGGGPALRIRTMSGDIHLRRK